MNTEEQARFEILSQNRKDLQTQVARIKQTIEKVPDKDAFLTERIRTSFHEQSITIFSVLTAISLLLQASFERGGGGSASPPKDEGWLGRLADALKRIAGKTIDIVVSVFGAILSFLGKVVGPAAEHTWALIDFVLGLIDWWLMQRVKKD